MKHKEHNGSRHTVSISIKRSCLYFICSDPESHFMPPIYSPLPTSDSHKVDLEDASSVRRSHNIATRKAAFRPLALLAIMCALVLTVRKIPAACRMIRNKEVIMNNVTVLNAQSLGRHGTNRTLSTTPGLPSFYTLPSGDKIPSVALGAIA